MPASVVIVGAGVSGLTTGVALLQAGFRVSILARQRSPHTTSDVAAAVWYPYAVQPLDRVTQWGRASFARFIELAADARSGILLREVLELMPTHEPDPAWKDTVLGFRCLQAAQLPPQAACVQAFRFESPVIDTSIYLNYLSQRFIEFGGAITQREAHSLDELAQPGTLLINCAGLGARRLLPDASMFSLRGQVVRVAQVGLNRVWIDEHHRGGITYIVPRAHDIILGGTATPQDESLHADARIAGAIVQRCIELEPALARAAILQHKVGLRPGRPTVRLEAETLRSGAHVIHNYGHGGAGVTLSWGCAQEVVKLALQLP